MKCSLFRNTVVLLLLLNTQLAYAWGNGQKGNAATNEASECQSPPYSTHDWIADKALSLLPEKERQWLETHKTLYLLGTEAPDNKKIPTECGAPNNGYDDRQQGHSVEWNSDFTQFTMRLNGQLKSRPAWRAREEYEKAAKAFRNGNKAHAAYYLGAMAHYIGDVSQFGHAITGEDNHSNYESFVGNKTQSFVSEKFDRYIQYNGPTNRKPYTAVKRISKVTAKGKGKILPGTRMDALYKNAKNTQEYMDSIGHSLNLGINELADVLHRFFKKEVESN